MPFPSTHPIHAPPTSPDGSRVTTTAVHIPSSADECQFTPSLEQPIRSHTCPIRETILFERGRKDDSFIVMTPPLRILMLIPELGFGGAEGSFLRLAHHLALEAEVTIAVMGDSYSDPSNIATRANHLPVMRLDEGIAAGRGQPGKARRWWGFLRRLRSLKQRHDVTISFLSGMNLLNALTGSWERNIVSERGSKRYDISMNARQRLIWTHILDPLTYWCSGVVVAASEGLAHEILTANPWAVSRVVAIEGSVQAAALVDAADLPVEPEFEPLADYETVVAFGRLHLQKGFDALLSAFALVRLERPKARLLLIGAGPEEVKLRILAVERGLRIGAEVELADVILPGLRPDPIRYLKLGRVFALPSRYEGLPNALIEALASGVPILASDCPWGPRSILSDGELPYCGKVPSLPRALAHGVLMPLPDAPGATTVWAVEIARVLAKPPLPRPERAARLSAIAQYDITRTGPRWMNLARGMAGNAGLK